LGNNLTRYVRSGERYGNGNRDGDGNFKKLLAHLKDAEDLTKTGKKPQKMHLIKTFMLYSIFSHS
jgi:hypothetical protein